MSASFEFGSIQYEKKKKNFAEIFKNLIRSKSNFVGPLKELCRMLKH